jgi:hypothetical protein
MPEPAKLNNQQVGQAGEHFVAGELHRRGAYAVTFSGNMPNIDILASDVDRSRTVSIQVKTKTTGTWHTTITRGEPREANPGEDRFWVLVDIGRDSEPRPDYYIVPEWWMVNHIHTRTREKKLGERESTHFAIIPKNVADWQERWELLGIF